MPATGVSWVLWLVSLSLLSPQLVVRAWTPPYQVPFNGTIEVNTSKPPVIGVIHMAKAAGSSLNTLLALTYERVCGNKGNSFDAFMFNEKRIAEHSFKAHRVTAYKTAKWLSQMGPEDCDLIMEETKWDFWPPLEEKLGKLGIPMELHVPCREPIDHLLSQCNYKVRSFNCSESGSLTDKDIRTRVEECLITMDRFSYQLKNVKCFKAIPFEPYVQYLSTILSRRRIVSTPYPVFTNIPRPKDECLLQPEHQDLRAAVREYLVKHVEYYNFCEKCMKSSTTRIGNE